jgi:hypothetical protein
VLEKKLKNFRKNQEKKSKKEERKEKRAKQALRRRYRAERQRLHDWCDNKVEEQMIQNAILREVEGS